MTEQHAPTPEQLWEQDRALLDEYGRCHIETICGTAAGLRAEGKEDEASELDRQCARMRIILLSDEELLRFYERSGGEAGDGLTDPIAAEIYHRELDI